MATTLSNNKRKRKRSKHDDSTANQQQPKKKRKSGLYIKQISNGNYECVKDKDKVYQLLDSVNALFKCPWCQKENIKRTNLVPHTKVHLNLKEYECTICKSLIEDKSDSEIKQILKGNLQ